MLCAATSAMMLVASRVQAQVTEVARSPIADVAQITFGYRCDDRFVVRNDGTSPVVLEYAVTKGTQHYPLSLQGREQVELASTSKEPLELWMNGTLIATAEKEKRSCKSVPGNATVAVAPYEVPSTERTTRVADYGYGPYYDPWYSRGGFYAGFGFRPYYQPFIGVPIIVGGRGGHRR
jgi:hypothetical protein